MKRRMMALLLALLLLPAVAAAKTQYILSDSNTRYLTEDELWEWDYESLGYIFNEIFARHGYNFNVGGRYYNYFMTRPWYTPNANSDNSKACYPKLNAVEWSNERLIKDVRAEMRAQRTKNKGGKNYLDYVENDTFDVLSGFAYTSLKSGQKLAVYSAPNAASWRGANGKASVSTNGSVYVAGWESGWLLIMYETNNGAVRVGYVDGTKLKGNVGAPRLDFVYGSVALQADAVLTDDPATTFTTICRLSAGQNVTYLTSFQNRYEWAYVETTVNGQTVRGFLPAEALGYVDEGEDSENAVNG